MAEYAGLGGWLREVEVECNGSRFTSEGPEYTEAANGGEKKRGDFGVDAGCEKEIGAVAFGVDATSGGNVEAEGLNE
jgi:hypothetical protein